VNEARKLSCELRSLRFQLSTAKDIEQRRSIGAKMAELYRKLMPHREIPAQQERWAKKLRELVVEALLDTALSAELRERIIHDLEGLSDKVCGHRH